MDVEGLNNLIFYAIDKASPYALAQHEETNSLVKIQHLSLQQLAITSQGLAMMWQWINASSGQYGAGPVSPDRGSSVVTVKDVVDAVYAATGMN